MISKTISVIGLGYIGLPTAAVLASKGNLVHGIDINEEVVSTINSGRVHIFEPGLEALVHKEVNENRLLASHDVLESDIFLIAVPTPFITKKNRDPEPDLSFVKSAVKKISPFIKKDDLIILESTSPVETTKKISRWLSEYRKDLKFPHDFPDESDISIAYCPERVLPGNIIFELTHNSRVIGGISKKCIAKAKSFYEGITSGRCIGTNSETAEMVKLCENSFRDVNIAFANELSMICENYDIDVHEMIDIANLHPRVNILQPGPGVGGHCIAVDPWFLVANDPKYSRLIKTARQVNDYKISWVTRKVENLAKVFLNEHKDKKEVVIGCFGLTYKPDIDDLRESPAFEIVKSLQNSKWINTIIVEPNLDKLPPELEHLLHEDPQEGVMKSDIILLLVDHKEFKDLDMNKKEIINTCSKIN